MSGAIVDTNVLVYAYLPAGADPRTAKAKTTISALVLAGDGYVSVQNLAELSSVCLTKLRPPLPPTTIKEMVSDLRRALSVLQPTASTVESALVGVDKHRLSFWDAMLWAIAKENSLGEILSEDFQDGQLIEGVRFTNPLK
jgi:predicted nucleic acid-binding protein